MLLLDTTSPYDSNFHLCTVLLDRPCDSFPYPHKNAARRVAIESLYSTDDLSFLPRVEVIIV